MISTLDIISKGRATLGIGAGWKEDEWKSYGYGFPEPIIRLQILEDHLQVITAMFASESATYHGQFASVENAFSNPKGLQTPRVPILVGGNGPRRTWRIAARFADELNLDALTPAAVRAAIPVISE